MSWWSKTKRFPKSLKKAPMRKKRSGGLHAWIASKPRVKSTFQQRKKVFSSATEYSIA
jgi:hypothetical protein